jgi:hypothetical protein
VKLDIGQPDAARIRALSELLDDYLYRPTVAQPLECFQSLLLAFCRQEDVDLWKIQEEDPALVRHVDDTGTERLPGRLAALPVPSGSDPAAFVEHWAQERLAEGGECSECAFFGQCRGYFKWPQRDYDCSGIKTLLWTLQQAGDELRRDLAAAESRPRSAEHHER